jgi:hypothetical protein
MRNLVESANAHVALVKARLPSSFPERVIDAIAAGVKQQAAAFIATLPPALPVRYQTLRNRIY